jgi:hypothetical protein
VIYLYWYLGIGAVVLILMVAYHKLTKQKDDNLLSDILADLRPERKKLWFRLLNDVLGPALVGTLIVPFWPVLVFFKVKELVFGEPARGAVDEPEFAVTRDDLQTQLSIQEIEQREMVFDPLGAAPNVPFGHLNAAWKQFCEGMEPRRQNLEFYCPLDQFVGQERFSAGLRHRARRRDRAPFRHDLEGR